MAMNDFSISHGSWKKGALAAVGGVIKYVVVPILIVLGMITVMERAGVEELIESLGLRSLVMQVAILGEVVAALSFFRGFYPKGSLSRMTFGVISMAAAGVWLWTIVKGGDIALTSGSWTWGSGTRASCCCSSLQWHCAEDTMLQRCSHIARSGLTRCSQHELEHRAYGDGAF